MSNSENDRRRRLRKGVLFCLFATSYIPLFLLIVLKQTFKNWNFLFGRDSTCLGFLEHSFLSIILIAMSSFGLFGLWAFMKNIRLRASANYSKVLVSDVENRSGEAISYIGTYIIPFLFNNYNGWYEILSTLFLLYVIYRIYINSSLLLINPILNIRYALYQITYTRQGVTGEKSCMVITKNKLLEEGDTLEVYSLGQKLFIGVSDENEEH